LDDDVKAEESKSCGVAKIVRTGSADHSQIKLARKNLGLDLNGREGTQSPHRVDHLDHHAETNS
jgi:hypothetical protein